MEEQKKKIVERMVVLLLMLAIVIMMLYSLKVSNNYNELVFKLNNCTKSCMVWR